MASAYVVVHLILAGVCGVLFFVHAALWRHAKDRAQAWVALCLILYVPFLLEAAGGSHYGKGLLGPTLPWLVLGLPSPLIAALILNAVWRVMGIPVRGARRTYVFAGLLIGLAMISLNAWSMALAVVQHQPIAFDDFCRRNWVELPLSLYGMGLSGILLYDFWSSRRRLPALAHAGLLVIPMVIGLSLYQVAWSFHLFDGPFLIALSGLPFVVFCSTAMVSQYLKAVAVMNTRPEEMGEYRLVRKLATGGMGELFLAVRKGPGGFSRPVALKRMREEGRDDSEWTTRFLSEARLAATLRHPNIVAVYDLGRLPDGWFMVMEYLVGLSLSELKGRIGQLSQALPPELVLSVGEQVCRGLSHAHARGVIHRDMSPQNVMVTFDGEVKIVDFGIAKVLSEHEAVRTGAFVVAAATPESTQLTLPGRLLGKKGYFAPELIAGQPASPASDQFALGVVLHELLAGVKPLEEEGAPPRSRLRELRSELPSWIEPIIARALAPVPSQRFPSAEEMGKALRGALSGLPHPDLSGWLKRFLDDLWKTRLSEVETATASGGVATDAVLPENRPA